MRLMPPADSYRHNDIHLRDCPPDIPENAHFHLVALLPGSSDVIPVRSGELVPGQYQSVMLFELDGPHSRKVEVQICGGSDQGADIHTALNVCPLRPGNLTSP